MKISFRNSGFTLIEIAVAILIGGLVISLFANMFVNFNRVTKTKEANERMQTIADALHSYIDINGKLPCPARLTDAPETGNFGREADVECQNVVTGAGITVSGGVVIGTVPTRSINLPDDYMFDSWGSRYTYAVTAAQASQSIPYSSGAGLIDVVDTANNSLMTPPGTGAYALVSHGANRIGSHTADGVAFGETCDLTTQEAENCDNDGTFRKTLFNSSATTDTFDDFLIFKTGTIISPDIPSGAVLPFNLNACPVGWTPFAAAEGRSIIGVGDIAVGDPPGNTYSSTDVFFLGLGNIGGSPARFDSDPIFTTGQTIARYDNRPAFVALLYCEKN